MAVSVYRMSDQVLPVPIHYVSKIVGVGKSPLPESPHDLSWVRAEKGKQIDPKLKPLAVGPGRILKRW